MSELPPNPSTTDPLSLRETTPWMEEVERRRMPKPRDRVRGSKKSFSYYLV
jgi:hypothetical protein